jgi:ERCC4-type nuclease
MDLTKEDLGERTIKPFKIPENFVMISDTREQLPLFDKDRPKDLIIKHKALKDGDYSIEGYEHLFAIERKQMSDLMGYIGKERVARTMPKMLRFREIVKNGGFVALVIEASEQDVLAGYLLSKLQPEHIRMALVSFEVRYGVRVYYNRDRKHVARWVLDRMLKFYQIMKEME